MTVRRGAPGVTVLDLRDGGCGVGTAEGPVVVLDHADAAAEHDEIYQALLGSPQVSGVICLALDRTSSGGTPGGGPGGGPGAAVTVHPAPSLAPADHAGTVWVGDQHGIRWRPTDPVVRPVPPAEPSGLRQLIDALGEPAVFDAVTRCVSTLPYSTASAGLVLERTSLHRTELSRGQEEAFVQFTDPEAGRTAARELPREEFRAAARALVEIDSAEDVLLPGGELAAARARAIGALNAVSHELTRLDHRAAPFPRHRPGRGIGGVVEEARAAARDYHHKVTRQLLRIDENLRGQRVPAEVVTQLGVRAPVPARARDIRDRARHLVEEWLGRYRSIAHLLPDLDAARIEQEPQGCPVALAELDALRPPTGPAPEAAVWPGPLLAVPLAALSGVLAALGTAPGIVTRLLALAWFVAGLLLHARQPTATGEQGFLAALAPALLGWGVPVLAGWFLAVLVGVPGPGLPWNIGLTVLAGLVWLTTLGLSWRRGVRRWRRALRLDELRAQVGRTDQLLDEVLRTEWRTCAQRALLTEGLRRAALGLTSIREVLVARAAPPADDLSDRLRDVSPEVSPERDVHEEVREVVVTDLVDLTLVALRPCWAGIETGRPGGNDEPTQEAERLLASYRDHVERHGLAAAPPFARRRGDRATLATQLWAGSHVTSALARSVEDEMIQLCHAGQIGAVSALAGGAQLVRFAPPAVRGTTWNQPGPGPAVTWTGDAEIAGTLRFVPLRQGVVR